MDYNNFYNGVGRVVIQDAAISDDALAAATDAAQGVQRELGAVQRNSRIVEMFTSYWPESDATLVPMDGHQARFWVCFPNETLPRGWIGHGYHHTFADTTDDKYMIFSLSLEAYRYRHRRHEERRHMAFSNSFDGIMKRAKKAFIPITTKLICCGHRSTHLDAVRSFIDTKTDMLKAAYKKMTGLSMGYGDLPKSNEWPFFQELQALDNIGHTWTNSVFGTAVPELLSSVTDLEYAKQNQHEPMVYVWPNENAIKVLPVGDVDHGQFQGAVSNATEFSYDSTEDLPDGYKNKLAMLQIVPDGTFLPNVGTRCGYGYFLFQEDGA